MDVATPGRITAETQLNDVLARYPRLGLGEEFTGYFDDQAKRKPLCLAARSVRSGFAARVAANPLDRKPIV